MEYLNHKYCPRCGTVKHRTDFYKDLGRYDGVCSCCRACDHIKSKAYRLAHPKPKVLRSQYTHRICTECREDKPISEFCKDRSKNTRWFEGHSYVCKECQKRLRKEKWQREPWKKTLQFIRARCNNPKNGAYKYYGGRGIKCLITWKELKTLWFRDNAASMNKPSIDRKDVNGNYTFENCQYMEMIENNRKMNKERRQILN